VANHVQATTPTAQPSVVPRPLSKKFAKIKAKPKASWSISDIETACQQLGLTCQPPTRGSHYKVSSPHIGGILPIPCDRPVKTVYIKLFIGLGDAHIEACKNVEKSDG